MTSDVQSLLKSHLPYGNSGNSPDKQIPFEHVDELADILVREYDNVHWRSWYCGVINKYGIAKVHEWQRRASEGRTPGKLFTKYVNQAGGYKHRNGGP